MKRSVWAFEEEVKEIELNWLIEGVENYRGDHSIGHYLDKRIPFKFTKSVIGTWFQVIFCRFPNSTAVS